jgi:glutathione gamma-glutamylcysteinyltransferase
MKKLPEHISMYKKKIPKPLIPFASEQGKNLFKQALNEGNMQNFFDLSEQFVTQARPEDCAVSSLVMVLNSLGIDPGKKWKGPWRWYSEDLLSCVDQEKSGFSLHEFLRLARCNKAHAMGFYAKSPLSAPSEDYTCGEHSGKLQYRSVSMETFRTAVLATCRQAKFYMAANYSRKALGQSGDGHYSPIAGYNEASDMCLILDVARFKYPAYWLPLSLAYEALVRPDPETQKPRGFVCVSRSRSYFSPLCSRQADFVSLQKLKNNGNSLRLESYSHDLSALIFRFYYNLYEDLTEAEISSLCASLSLHSVPLHPKFESLCSDLNPNVKDSHFLLLSVLSSRPASLLKVYSQDFGL